MRYFLTAAVTIVATLMISWPFAMAFGISRVSTTAVSATLMMGFIAASLTIAATVIAIWGVYSQRWITRRQTTVQHLFSLKADASIQRNLATLIKASRNDQNLAAWADKDKIGEETTLAIIAVLNDYELLSTGIQNGIYDFEIVRQYDASTLKRVWKNALPFVAALRNRTNVPTLWKEFELLHCWIEGSKNPTFTLFIKGLA